MCRLAQFGLMYMIACLCLYTCGLIFECVLACMQNSQVDLSCIWITHFAPRFVSRLLKGRTRTATFTEDAMATTGQSALSICRTKIVALEHPDFSLSHTHQINNQQRDQEMLHCISHYFLMNLYFRYLYRPY